MAQRRRYPEPGRTAGEAKLDSSRLDTYLAFWKVPDAVEKGTVWIYCSRSMADYAKIRMDPGIPFRQRGYRPSLLHARGILWIASWQDGSRFGFKASPQVTKALMASLAGSWGIPPQSLQRDNGRPFDLASLAEESHSHVYLVRLLTFDAIADGRAYYKIGKAVSIPKRIKQFGPCQLIAQAQLPSEAESLRVEAELHQRFDAWRRPDTEIFCFDQAQLAVAVAALQALGGAFGLAGTGQGLAQ